MSLGELTAWQAGIDWGRAGHHTAAILAAPRLTWQATFGPDVADARDQLGGDTFAYWFRLGLDDHHSTTAH